jgi:hypothetical protein
MTAEQIGANDLPYFVREAVEPNAQIDRLVGERTFVPGGKLIIPVPHWGQYPRQRRH